LIRKLVVTVCCGALAIPVSAQSLAQQPTLKYAFREAFKVGVAVNRVQIYGEDIGGAQLIKSQFNSITPENVLKWEAVHPRPNLYEFEAADKFVKLGEENGMVVIGHTLVWHNQTPKWVFDDEKGNPISREALLARMREHIHKVVGRYKSRIKGWDVVNEALNEDGSLRASAWLKIIGEDYIEKAFQYAHEADPEAELYYNDYSLENESKRNAAVALLQKLKAKGVHVTSVGLQGHDNLEWPTVEQQDATITAFEQLGLKVNITELDITVLPSNTAQPTAEVTTKVSSRPGLNPYTTGLPDSVQKALANRYADLYRVFVKHRHSIDRVTFWGVTDADSWKNNWPAKGRTDYPLLFDRKGAPKPAFYAVLDTARVIQAKD
jgi:endo-1,4-beta-xylanase